MTTELSFDASGDHPAELIADGLDGIRRGDAKVQDVEAEIEFEGFSLTAEGETLAVVAEKLNAIKFDEPVTRLTVTFTATGLEEPEAEDEVAEAVSEPSDAEPEGDEEREVKHLKPGTMEHAVLTLFDTAVANDGTDTWATAKELRQQLPNGLTQSQVSNTLQRCWKKGLMDRRVDPDSDTYQHQYRMNSAGRGEMIRLGTADFAETPIPADGFDLDALKGSLADD